MAINPRNIVYLLQKTFSSYQYNVDSIITEEEKSFATDLENLIKNAMNEELFAECIETLTFSDESVYPETIPTEENNFGEGSKKSMIDVNMEYKKKAVQYWRSGKTKCLDFKRVQHKFRKVTHRKTLYRWKKQINECGTKYEKFLQISTYVLDQFKISSERSLPIHDIDIKRWALKAGEKFGLSPKQFTASTLWVHNFKTNHGIVSRKINKFVTKKQISSKEILLRTSSEFVSKVKSEIQMINKDNVYNSDQSGFNMETHAGRTLALKGSSKVECLAQSINSLTHSYTIQPIISANGNLKSPLFIVLQETGGKFGPTVEKNIYKADNILVFASKSGKLTSDLAIKWFENVFLPNTGEKSLLLLDSWTGQTAKKFDSVEKHNKEVQILTIPAGTTGLIQPLDVYTFRPWKNFLKQFSDIVMLYNYDINLHSRNNILKIQSLIHNQFSSPRFKNMFLYAWWKCGYIAEKPDKWESPTDFCLRNCNGTCEYCNDIAIIRCGWCMKSNCMQHFFAITNTNSPHYCTEFKVSERQGDSR